VSEIAPARLRSRLLVAAFSFQAVGQVLGVLVGLAILNLFPTFTAWRPMLAFGVIPAALIVWLRRSVPESPKWLAATGHLRRCATVMTLFCERRVEVEDLETGRAEAVDVATLEVTRTTVTAVSSNGPGDGTQPEPGRVRWLTLFGRRLRAVTLLTSAPWFLMDIATYGVGIFTRRSSPRSRWPRRTGRPASTSPPTSPPRAARSSTSSSSWASRSRSG
jgi:MFS family permease